MSVGTSELSVLTLEKRSDDDVGGWSGVVTFFVKSEVKWTL